MSTEEEEIYRRLMREKSAKGGRNAWKGKNKKVRAAIMSKRWKRRREKAEAARHPTRARKTRFETTD